MTLPYENSKADPAKAQQRIRSTLTKFGVSSIGFSEDFENREIFVNFKYKEYPVCMPIDYAKLAEIYLEDDPWSWRRNGTENEWIEKKRQIAYRASFSLLDDYLKGLITIVELGVFSFEEAFFAYFVNNQGQRIGEMLTKKLPELVGGKLALTDGG